MASKKTASKSKLKTIIIENNEEYKFPKSFTGIVKVFRVDPRTKERYLHLVSYFKKGEHHRLDGPAKVWNSGLKEWFKDGKYHREDGPVIEWSDRPNEWFLNGVSYSENQWKMKLRGEEPIQTPVSKVSFIPKDPDPLGLNPAPVKKFYPSFMEVRSRDIQPLPPPKKEFNLTSWSQYGIDWS